MPETAPVSRRVNDCGSLVVSNGHQRTVRSMVSLAGTCSLAAGRTICTVTRGAFGREVGKVSNTTV
jgi:uncharacterized protein YgiB involved in biofilm formation